MPPLAVLDLLLRVPTQGLTNVTFALETAARQLAGRAARRRAGAAAERLRAQRRPRPAAAAARLPRLDVLLDTSGEVDVELGRELARRPGRLRRVRDHRDVAAGLTAVFAD